MARSTRDTRLETRSARLKLETGQRYWKNISTGIALGYRRTTEGFGTWSVRMLQPDGRYQLKQIGCADDHLTADGNKVLDFFQVQEKIRSLLQESANHSGGLSELLTVQKAAEYYLAWYKEHRRAFYETQSTIEAHILPVFGSRLVRDLKTLEIKNWLNDLATAPPRRRTSARSKKPNLGELPTTQENKRKRKSTANRILTVFKAILNKAFEDERVADDTAWRRVRPFENVDEPITRFLTADEAMRLLHACQPDFQPLVKAALFTGARYQELASLRASQINLTTGQVVFLYTKTKSRVVPLSAEARDFFARLIQDKPLDAPVFVKASGAAWGKNHQVRPLQEACERASIVPAITFHDLRHSYASLLAQAGVDLLTISKLLGHADTRVTSRHYAHLCDRTLALAVQTHLPSFGHKIQETTT